jgi:molecular chaperone DnaJ
MNKEKNYYKILDLPFDFSTKQLKKSYRFLSTIYHPDKNKDGDSTFKEIVEAYRVLSDENLRSQYDRKSKYGKNYDIKEELYEFEFSNVNVANQKVSNKKTSFKQKELIHIVLELDEFKGEVSYNRNVICSSCDGTGNSSVSNLNLQGKMGDLFTEEEIKCDICEGSGMFNSRECPSCGGDGYIKLGMTDCEKCNGEGLIVKRKTIKLNKDDFQDGKLKKDFLGNQSKFTGRTGNLYIIIKN